MPTADDDQTGEGPEILFYHLERARLIDVLPSLLQKSLGRGWRAVVQTADKKQAEQLNTLLWTWREDSFLPHGAAGDGFAERQPVYLTESEENPNRAAIRFFVGGAQPVNVQGYERIVYMFDGRNEQAVAQARQQWKRLADGEHNVTYWRQNEHGGWEKKA